MWALCRASNPHKLRSLAGAALKLCCTYSHIQDPKLTTKSTNGLFFETVTKSTSNTSLLLRSFSSQASSSTSNSDDGGEDLFAELNMPLDTLAIENENSHSDPARPSEEEPTLSKSFADEHKDRTVPELFVLMRSTPVSGLKNALLNWVEGDKELHRKEVEDTFRVLRSREMFLKALHLSEFLETHKDFTFTLRDYIRHLDLVAKVKGIIGAERYIEKVPPEFHLEPLYRTLLSHCVASCNLKKSEEVFNKMKDLEFPLSTFTLNQLLLLYRRLDKKKIADVLFLMEKSEVQPDQFTFRILVSAKGLSKDITGMEQVIETMKTMGIEPDNRVKTGIAKYYISAGFREEAETLMRELEGESMRDKETRVVFPELISLYASLGRPDDVTRVWRMCESNPRPDEYLAAIDAYGKLKDLEAAEMIFKAMSSKWKRLSVSQYGALLGAYVDNGCYEKGKELVQTIAEKGIRTKPDLVDLIVRLHVGAGEVDRADSVLADSVKNRVKPMFRSFISVMSEYAVKGDIHNAENMFNRMRESGYVARAKQFSVLLLAYVKAKTPAYGIKDRMKADNVFPDKKMAAHMADVDPFWKSTLPKDDEVVV